MLAYTTSTIARIERFQRRTTNFMKIWRGGFAAMVLTAAGAMAALAQPVELGGPPQIIIHKTNPHMEAGAPPAGSTGIITPMISYHGGPVMATPTAYLIWYGNWNQSNGSDTPAGQAIVNDFLYGLSGSPYYVTNASYGAPTGTFSVRGAFTDGYSQGSVLNDRK